MSSSDVGEQYDEIFNKHKHLIPTREELSGLPHWALVAFAARCGRLVQPKFHGEWLSEESAKERSTNIQRVLSFAEQAAAAGTTDTESALEVRDDAQGAYAAFHGAWSDGETGDAHIAMLAVRAFNLTIRSIDPAENSDDDIDAMYFANDAFDAAFGNLLVASTIKRDFELLRSAAVGGTWTDATRIAPAFFALHSDFDSCDEIEQTGIISVSAEINAKLIEYFRRWPERLFDLSPRQFEELVAELFDGFGYEVELTKRTRDGGCDVVAISSIPVDAKLLIECKRYAKDRTVGVDVVRSLHGTTMAQGANKGILVTTGKISADARNFMAQPNTNWLLDGRDFDGLVEWLELYQQFQMGKIIRSVAQ